MANTMCEKWRLIETAPKDGTMFIGWVSAERHSQIDGEGSGYGHDTSEADFCQWKAVVSHPDGGYFDNMMGQIGDAQAVTHWIPMAAMFAVSIPEQNKDAFLMLFGGLNTAMGGIIQYYFAIGRRQDIAP